MEVLRKLFKDKNVSISEPIDIVKTPKYTFNAHAEEEKICKYFIDFLSEKKEANKLMIEHRSQDYTSLVYGNNDFMRIKFTQSSKWISFSLSENDRHEYENASLFDLTQKKSSIHWRASINSFDDLSKFLNIAERACYELKIAGSDSPTEEEKIICDYIKELLLSMGARECYITYHHYDSYAKTNYCGRDIFKFKILKFKANYAMMEENIAKKAKLKLNSKKHLEFISVENLKNMPELVIYVKLQFERFKSLEKYYDSISE